MEDYAVVKFIGDEDSNSFSEVPSIWLTENNTKCWWPILTKNVLIAKKAEPNTETWKKFEILVECFYSKF